MGNVCVFCDRTQIADRIVYEDEKAYVVPTIGQISEGYVLVIPKTHVSCLGAMPREDLRSLVELVKRVSDAETREYGIRPILFEHGIVGQSIPHAHLHIVPVSVDLMPSIRNDFPKCNTEDVAGLGHLRARYAENLEPYLFWQTPGGLCRVCWNPPAPLQYLRTVLANALGRPESANWRNADPAIDSFLIKASIRRLKPYFN